MIHDSKEFNMARRLPGEADVKRILDSWKQFEAVPSLKGVDVYVWGASHPDERSRSIIERFWKELFSALGGQLRTYAPQALDATIP
jgi:hypothetical protein